MRPVIPSDDLAPYRLHSRVAHSCLLPSLLRTAYIHELYIHVSWRGYSVPPTFRSRTAFSVAHIVRAGSTDIWSPPHLDLHSLVSLLDMNSSVYFSTQCDIHDTTSTMQLSWCDVHSAMQWSRSTFGIRKAEVLKGRIRSNRARWARPSKKGKTRGLKTGKT